ncbi:hypothetical protein B0J18DRAFT_11346 [Chaetomium sp. MPI-SDFR-AT-0129]|nr:hypothetical protein B0J18DRAFT_11346 [Chaetomium sp. MPI-SDFR-AT-0129]
MAYPHDYYYAAPAPQNSGPLELYRRSPSVSSNSSSTSFSAPYNAISVHSLAASRTMSPASSSSDSATNTVAYPRHQFSTLTHDHSNVYRTHPAPFPSQYIQHQVSASLSFCAPFQHSQQIQRPAYGEYPVSSIPHQPSMLHEESGWPSGVDPTLPPSTSYPTPSPSYAQPKSREEREELNSRTWFISGLRSLPPEVLLEIQKHVTWYHCWKVSQTSRWFQINLHPDRLPMELKQAGMLNTEKNGGRDECDVEGEPVVSKGSKDKRKPAKDFQFYGCYHCCRFKGPDQFEAQKHGTTIIKEEESVQDNHGDSGRSVTPLSPPSNQTPSANPHYDPSLTRSSLRASAADKRRRVSASPPNTTGRGDASSTSNRRVKSTFGLRRFCVNCGLRNEFYIPGDLIELHQPRERGDALWVCECKVLHSRLTTPQCLACNSIAPLSVPR